MLLIACRKVESVLESVQIFVYHSGYLLADDLAIVFLNTFRSHPVVDDSLILHNWKHARNEHRVGRLGFERRGLEVVGSIAGVLGDVLDAVLEVAGGKKGVLLKVLSQDEHVVHAVDVAFLLQLLPYQRPEVALFLLLDPPALRAVEAGCPHQPRYL